jgi:hypothetical protein
MGLPKPRERRFEPRRRTIGFLPGELLAASGADGPIECKPIDVSAFGLGIFSEADLEETRDYVLKMGGQLIELELIWSEESPGKMVGYRHGLRVKDPRLDLEALFTAAGCL